VITKACLVAGYSLALAAHALLARPFLSEDAWKGWVRALILVVTAGCAVSNACSTAVDLGYGGDALAVGTARFAYVLLALVISTAAVLVASFCASVWASALAEQRDIDVRVAAALAARALGPRRRKLVAPREGGDDVVDGMPATEAAERDAGVSTVGVNPLFASARVGRDADNASATAEDKAALPERGDWPLGSGGRRPTPQLQRRSRAAAVPHGTTFYAVESDAGSGVSTATDAFAGLLSPTLVRNPLRSAGENSTTRLRRHHRRPRSLLRSQWAAALSEAAASGCQTPAAAHAAALAARDALLSIDSAILSAADASALAAHLCSLVASHESTAAAASVTEAACEALAALTRAAGAACVVEALAVRECAALQALVNAIAAHGSSSCGLLAAASDVLAAVAAYSEGMATLTVQSAAVPALLAGACAAAATASTVGEFAAAEASLRALAVLTAHEAGAAAVTEEGGMEALAGIVARSDRHRSPGLLVAAATLLANAAAHADSVAAGRFLASRGIPALVGLLQRSTSTDALGSAHGGDAAAGAPLAAAVASAICSIAANFASESGAAALSYAGAGPALAAAIKAYPRDAAVIEAACWSFSLLLQQQRHGLTVCSIGGEEGVRPRYTKLVALGVGVVDAAAVEAAAAEWAARPTSVHGVEAGAASSLDSEATIRARAMLILIQPGPSS
jgi:hypothetical protein